MPAASSNESLCQLAQRGDDAAVEQLLAQNEGLIRSIAARYLPFCGSLTEDDLLQEGRIALLLAIRRYDPARGTKLTTMAHYWIRQGIQRAIANQDRLIRLPAHACHRASELPAVTCSLDAPLGDEEEGLLGDVLPAPGRDSADVVSERVWLEEGLSQLTDRERFVVEARAAGESLLALAPVVGRSREGVRQIERRACEKLRAALAG